MTQFTIPAETFTRIAKASGGKFPFVRLEYKDGHYYAIASTGFVMAVEYLGQTTELDAAVNVPVIQCDEDLTIWLDWYPEFNVLTCTVDGASVPMSPIPDTDVPGMFVRWWQMYDDVGKDKGFLYIEADLFQTLAASSPSGYIVFPVLIDNTRTTFVRDAIDPNWIGFFVAADKSKQAKAAVKPEWLP